MTSMAPCTEGISVIPLAQRSQLYTKCLCSNPQSEFCISYLYFSFETKFLSGGTNIAFQRASASAQKTSFSVPFLFLTHGMSVFPFTIRCAQDSLSLLSNALKYSAVRPCSHFYNRAKIVFPPPKKKKNCITTGKINPYNSPMAKLSQFRAILS